MRDLTWVKAEYDSIRGTIASHWTLHEGHFTLTVIIPPNTTALVYVPATVKPRVKPPAASPLVKFQRIEGADSVGESLQKSVIWIPLPVQEAPHAS